MATEKIIKGLQLPGSPDTYKFDIDNMAYVGTKKQETLVPVPQDASTINGKHENELQVLNSQQFAGYTWKELMDKLHPVGSWWFSDDPTSPASLFGGEWTPLEGKRGLIAAIEGNPQYKVTSMNGEEYHILSSNEMPSHQHYIATSKVADGHHVEGASQYISPWHAAGISSNGENEGEYYIAQSEYSGKNQPHNNMPPYYATYIWRRIA